jgi:hypothetical protein
VRQYPPLSNLPPGVVRDLPALRSTARRGTSLVPLFDLAAAVDDKGHFLAVLRRLHSSSFGGRFDVSDLRITPGYKLGDKLLLGQGMGGGTRRLPLPDSKEPLDRTLARTDLYSLLRTAEHAPKLQFSHPGIICIGRRDRQAVEGESQTSIRHALRSPDDHS